MNNKIYHDPQNMAKVKDKIVVFVGGTDGMGRIAFEDLANSGAEIFLLGRTPNKTKKVIHEVTQKTGNKRIHHVVCDLSLKESVRHAANEVAKSCSHIDYLINCAGANIFEHIITSEGHELSWATNHLGPFLLTNLLLDHLKKAPKARIVNLSSAMQGLGRIDFDIIEKNKPTSSANRYGMAKLSMIMCTQELAKELEGTNVTINALNPGFINTNLMRRAKGLMMIPQIWSRLFASPPRVGAERILTLVTSNEYEGVSGKFIYEDYIREPNKQALDLDLVRRVYSVSRKQVGIA
ncbi:MAG: SDR family NAD(P)-dependent oxidoreductase [Firmicutes bacterium]|jgi:NAD(P)-dependent dehydrogenase (short-subunit alcohol dehydrogenase family)|nr:SDR family NAD(P)-dependent oxidoreductase [Bacillota bacterium]